MNIKPRSKTAGLKTVSSSTTPSTAVRREFYTTAVQNEAVENLIRTLHSEHGDDYSIKQYWVAIEKLIKKTICYGTVRNCLLGAEIIKNKPQKNPARSRSLQSKKHRGE